MRCATKIKTISDGLAQDEDNFLVLRLIAAAMVIYGHAPAITGGYGSRDIFLWLGFRVYSGQIALELFFIISGFLITGSYLRRKKLFEFAWARVLRIVPAYAACLLGCAFILGPIVSTLPAHSYFLHPETINYVEQNIKFSTDMIWTLPDVFTANPKTPTVNGAIWTLPAEVRMYAWVAVLGLLGIIARQALFNVTLIGLVTFSLLYPASVPLVPISDFYGWPVFLQQVLSATSIDGGFRSTEVYCCCQ